MLTQLPTAAERHLRAIGLAALAFGEDGNGIVLKVVIYVLAVLTNLTVIQRIWWVWRNTRPEGVAVGKAVPKKDD